MPSETYSYLQLGANLANKHADLNKIFEKWPRDRTAILVVCRPHPEVAAYVRNWLQQYANGSLKDGAVLEETFSLMLDAKSEKYQIVLKQGRIAVPTATVFVDEGTFWDICARVNTLYTAFITGKPVVVQSNEQVELRDMVHLDEILNVIHKTLTAKGIDFAQIAKG